VVVEFQTPTHSNRTVGAVEKCAPRPAGIFVGDAKQSFYGFRGAKSKFSSTPRRKKGYRLNRN
jgi:ATP-dependent exoDNAse (exonuclease V) beta subunit